MFEKETVDAILNGSLLIVWAIVFGLAYYEWHKYWRMKYEFISTPTKYTMHWQRGWKKGDVSIIRCCDCYEPKLTRGFNSWNFVIPLDYHFDDLARFIQNVNVPEYYVQTNLDALNLFRELVCNPKIVCSGELFGEEALEELLNHGVVLKHYPDNVVFAS